MQGPEGFPGDDGSPGPAGVPGSNGTAGKGQKGPKVKVPTTSEVSIFRFL